MKGLLYKTLAFSLLTLAGCSGGDDDGVTAGTDYIRFGAQVQEPVTRAQQPGSMDFNKLATTGFGVYGYGPATADYSSGAGPTLFSNAKVAYHATASADESTTLAVPGSWSYAWNGGRTEEVVSQLKTWPKSTDTAQKLTFFAYAPYMESGGTEPGITSVSADGAPTIGYTVADNPAASVDLLWGVQSETGLPWIDVTRAKKSASAVLFTMRHALCAVGYHAQVMVNKDNELTDLVDASSSAGGTKIGSTCRVTIESITLKPKTAGKYFFKKGSLNLNNSTPNVPNWTKTPTASDDDRIASLELSGEKINAELRDDPATGTTFMAGDDVPGITETANTQAVIAGDDVYMLIPDDAQGYTATIDYYVTYKTGDGTYQRTRYTGTATIENLALKAGTKYYLNLVFGLTTFKLTVTAEDWTDTPITVETVAETGTSASSSLSRRFER